MKLVWNDVENGWECSECGALYENEEVARLFMFGEQVENNFVGGYCMDCGVELNEVEV